jgi:hypothetical protein
MNPTRSVVYALLLSISLMVVSGSEGIRKLRNGINATVGRPQIDAAADTGAVLSVELFTGWAILFVILVALADNDTTSPLGVGFAYLLLLSVAMAVGPDAFNNIASLTGQGASSSGGGGNKKKR